MGRRREALALIDGEVWTVSGHEFDRRGHRPPAAADAGALERYAAFVPHLVPQRSTARAWAGLLMLRAGAFWIVASVIGGLVFAERPALWIALAVVGVVAALLGPGWVLRRAVLGPPRWVMPVEVLRDHEDDDGLHTIVVREVDDTRVEMIATPPLATVLLISSDFDADLTDVVPDEEAAMALVNPRFPAGIYPEPAVRAQLERAAAVAGVTVEELQGRVEALVSAGVAGRDEDVSAVFTPARGRVGRVAVGLAAGAWIPIWAAAEWLSTAVIG